MTSASGKSKPPQGLSKEFEQVVETLLKTPPKPHSKMKTKVKKKRSDVRRHHASSS